MGGILPGFFGGEDCLLPCRHYWEQQKDHKAASLCPRSPSPLLVHCHWLVEPYRLPKNAHANPKKPTPKPPTNYISRHGTERADGGGDLPLPMVLVDLTATCKTMTGCRLNISKNSGWQSEHGELRSVP